MNKRTSAIIIAPSWPVPHSGTGFAVASLLRQCVHFFPHTRFIGMVEHPFGGQDLWDSKTVEFVHVPVKRFSREIRFALTLALPLPAICHQFLASLVRKRIIEIIAEELNREQRTVLIFEDLPIPIALLTAIRARFPALPIAIRSENVASKIFMPLRDTGPFFRRLAWRIEVAKLHKREAETCRLANQIWAISLSDLQEYERRLGIYCNGVFGVSVDTERYATVPEGDIKMVISIGTVDLRKSLGLQKFVADSWPQVVSRYPTARLLLGGLNSERLTDPQRNILGIGRVEDDRDILDQGLIMVNTQEIGAGVNLKSIVAMASGKALVSTQKGIEGIEGVNGKHFLAGTDAGSLAPLILALMDNPTHAWQMGQEARKFAASMYSEARLEAQVRPLLERLVATT